MAENVGHEIEAKERTSDVKIKTILPFSKMVLSEPVQKGLQQARFIYPTNIQATAIPVGKSGIDLMVQSKSGTGKTLIFSVIILEAYQTNIREPQSLVVAPTREIAVQIDCILNEIGRFCPGFRSVAIIGGLDVTEDRKKLVGAKAVVGTPGRVRHLIHNDVLNTSRMQLFVLDEADKMYSQSFRQDINRIRDSLPTKLQTIACSATFCNDLDKELAQIMKNPLLISTENRATLLVGIKQFVYELPENKTSIAEMNTKLDAIKKIFAKITFRQCIVFAGSQSRADSYKNYLEKDGWPCELITAAQDQKTRLGIFKKLRDFKLRILIATDLMSRGIDSENVNLVINMECPADVVTYLHRIGRAGRFGSHGIAISFIASEKDRKKFTRMISDVGTGMNVLKFPKCDTAMERDFWDFSDYAAEEKIYGCFGDINTAPLASKDNSIVTTNEEQKENIPDNICSSSIDTKTFQLDSGDSALNMKDMQLMERDETNLHMLTPESRQSSSLRLPSSNTIDDASSIAADSDNMRGSQQNSIYQSILMEKAAIPTLVEFLVDQEVEKKTHDEIDFFDDYKQALDQSQKSTKDEDTSESLRVTAQKVADYKNLLIDKPTQSAKIADSAVSKDIYSDYANFSGDEDSASAVESISQMTCAEDIDRETFILSVATPSPRESIEEMDGSNLELTSDSRSVPEKKHFPSPAKEVDPLQTAADIFPVHLGLPFVGEQLDRTLDRPSTAHSGQSPTLTNNSRNSGQSVDNMSPLPQIESPVGTGSEQSANSNRSSGFDEKPSSGSSGIVASAQSNVAAEGTTTELDTPTAETYAESDDSEENYFDENAVGDDIVDNISDNVKYVDYDDDDDDTEGGNSGERDHKKDDHQMKNQKKRKKAKNQDAEEVSEGEEEEEEEEYDYMSEIYEEDLEDFAENSTEDVPIMQSETYQIAHARWMAHYWQQVTLVQDYSKFFIKTQNKQ